MLKKKRTIIRHHPGIYIKEALDSLNMSLKEFSIKTEIKEDVLLDLINEKIPLTYDIASKLANFFNNSVEAWMNLQKAFDNQTLENKGKR